MEQEIDRFQCRSDNGEIFTVIKYQEIERKPNLEGGILRRKLPVLRLEDGLHVTMLDAETFKILDTDEIIRKIG